MKGLMHIYTGDGKGKTTAAVGLCVRAAGSGLRVLLVQFLKGRDTGELGPLRAAGVEIVRSPEVKKFIPNMTPAELDECRAAQRRCFEQASEGLLTHDLVVLDEVMGAISTGMVSLDEVAALIRSKPGEVELVLTGRDAPDALISLADYVSEIRAVRHPYDQGVPARRGIEY